MYLKMDYLNGSRAVPSSCFLLGTYKVDQMSIKKVLMVRERP